MKNHKTRKMKSPSLKVPLEQATNHKTYAPLLEDTRMPSVRPDEGAASYKRDFPWMKPQ